MKKLIFLTVFTILASQSFAQNLEAFVPISSEFVLSVDSKKITEKIGKEKIFQSDLFNTITRDLILNKNPEVKINEIGINLDRGMAIFYNITESMEYMGVLYGIENESTFEKYVQENSVKGTIEAFEDFKILFFENNKELIAWNNEHAIYLKIEYLSDELNPLSSKSDSYWYRQYPELNPDQSIELTYGNVYEEGTCEEGDCDGGEIYEVAVEEYESVEVIPAEQEYGSEKVKPFTQQELDEMQAKLDKIKAEYEEKRSQRKVTLKAAYQQELSTYFKANSKESILSNKYYTQGKNSEADLYLWLNKTNMGFDYGLNNFYYPRRRYYRNLMTSLNYLVGEQLYANLFFKQDRITILAALKYNDKTSNLYNEIYDTKFSKKLLNQINAQQVLWISSISLNSERLWHHYPSIYASFIENEIRGDANFSEEIEVIVDFFEILMDEKALGDIATGDMIFVIKDFIETEVNYYSYEYNDDYSERTKVEKTRTDILPQFVGLFATNNQAFLEKILNLGVKHELLIRTNGYYQSNMNNREFPMEMGFAIKNGIAMISSDLFEIKAFSEGKLKGSLSKDLKSKIMKNQGYNRVDIREMMNKIPYQGFDGKNLATFECIQKNARTIELFSNFNNELFETTIDIAIPSNQKNGADYLWNFLHELDAIEKR